MKRLTIYLWVTLGVLVAFGLVVIFLPAGGAARAIAVDGGRVGAAATAAFFVAAAFVGVHGAERLRVGWAFFGLGVCFWLAADVGAFVYRLRAGEAPAACSSCGWLSGIGYALVIAAAALKLARPRAPFSSQALAGALAVAALGLVLTVNFVVIPALRNPGATGAEKAADVFFSGADFGVAALSLLVIALLGSSARGRPWQYAAIGLLFLAMGNVIQRHLAETAVAGGGGNVVSALFWVAGYFLIGMGAYCRRLLFTKAINATPGAPDADAELCP